MRLDSMAIVLLLFVLFPLLCVSEPGTKQADGISIGDTAVCTDTRVRVRSAPNLQSETLGHLDVDDRVEVLDSSAKKMMIGDMVSYWYRVRRLRDNLTGWSYGYFLEPLEDGKRLATIESLYPYLIDGVDFYISEGDIPVYAEPKENAQVLFTIHRGEAVTPIQVSDRPSSSSGTGFGMQEFWYLCAVNSEPDVVGWIRRQGLICKVDIDEDEIFIVQMFGLQENDIRIGFRQSFIDGEFQRIRYNRKKLEPGTVFNVFGTDAQELVGKIVITGTDPEIDRAAWFEGGERARSYALLNPKGDVTLGWTEYIPNLKLTHEPPQEAFHEHICLELAAATGKKHVDFDEISEILEAAYPVPITIHGNPFQGEATYHLFIGVYEEMRIEVACFLIRHPNGDVVRSNVDFRVYEIDREREAMWEKENGPRWFRVTAGRTEHFAQFPSTLITIKPSVYEADVSYLTVTNGYIVFNLGEWYHDGP